jgi:hypothetical protein
MAIEKKVFMCFFGQSGQSHITRRIMQKHSIKTVVTLDGLTTLEIDGLPRSGRVSAKLVKKVATPLGDTESLQYTGEIETLEFRLTDEVMRNLISVMETYR